MELLAAMLQFFAFQLKTRKDYEATQAYLNVFLKVECRRALAAVLYVWDAFHTHTGIHAPHKYVCLHVCSMREYRYLLEVYRHRTVPCSN